MMLDDVIGSDRDEFPLEQVQGLRRHPRLEEDWDLPGEPPFQDIFPETPRQEPISG